MNKLLFISLLIASCGTFASAQMKGDTTKPCTRCWPKIEQPATVPAGSLFDDIVFLLQQNKELSDRLDRAEKRIDSLEHRPYLFIDNKGVRPGVILTNSAGEYQILIYRLK